MSMFLHFQLLFRRVYMKVFLTCILCLFVAYLFATAILSLIIVSKNKKGKQLNKLESWYYDKITKKE